MGQENTHLSKQETEESGTGCCQTMEQINILPAHIFQPRWEWEKMEHSYTCYTQVTGQKCLVSSPNTVGCPLTRTLLERSTRCKWWDSIPLKLSGSFWEVRCQPRVLALQFCSQAQKDELIREWGSRLYLESLHLYPLFSSGLGLTYLLPRGVHKADLGLRDSKSEEEMILWAHFFPFATLNG